MAKLTTYQVTEIAKDTWVINEAGMTAMFLLKGTDVHYSSIRVSE